MSCINVEPEMNVEEMFNNTSHTSPHLYVQYAISGSVIFYPPRAYNINILPAAADGDRSLIQSHKICFLIQNGRIKLRNFSF